MSKTRIAVRVVLVLILLGVAWVGYRSWQRSQPDYYWDRAQAALQAENPRAAKINLQSLLSKYPEHFEGRMALAEVFLEEAKSQDSRASYANVPSALGQLDAAAALRPEDLELQKKLLDIYMRSGRMANAAQVAARVEKQEPDNPDALFLLTWRAVEQKKVKRADELIERLESATSPYAFRTLRLASNHYEATNRPERRQEVLQKACRLPAKMEDEQRESLSDAELRAARALFDQAVELAPDADAAQRRAEEAIAACEILLEAHPDLGGDLAVSVSRIEWSLRSKFPLPADAGVALARRADLARRAEAVRRKSIESDDAQPVVYYQSALASVAAGETEQALETLNRGLAAAAELPEERRDEALDLHLLAARLRVRAGRFAEAQPHLTALLQSERSSGWGHLLSGAVAAGQGRLRRALESFTAAQAGLGNTIPVRSALASVYLALGQWSDALPQLNALEVEIEQLKAEERAWVDQNMASTEQIHLGKLRALLGMRRWDEAQPLIEKLKGTDSEARAWALVVPYLVATGQDEAAEAALAEAREKSPEDLRLASLQAAMLRKAGKTDEADTLIEKFASQNPDDLRSQLLLAAWRLGNRRADEALALLDRLQSEAESKEDRLLVAGFTARALLAAGRPEEALEPIKLLRDDPTSAAAAGVLEAAVQWKQQDLQGAAASLESAEEAASGSGFLSLLRGQVAAAQGEFDAALEHVSDSLDVTSLRGPSALLLMQSLSQIARDQSPAVALDKAGQLLEEHPNDPGLLLAKADLLVRLNRHAEGMAVLDRLGRARPSSPAIPFFKGAVWLLQGRPDQAVIETRKALELSPGHIPSLALAASAELATRQYADALEHCETLLRLRPGAWNAELLKAKALEGLGRPAEAVGVLEELIQRRPKAIPAYLLLAEAYATEGRPEKARQAYREGREQVPDDLRLAAAEIGLLIRSDQLDEAKKLADEVAGAEPDFRVCVALGQAFYRAQQAEIARVWWQRAMGLAGEQEKLSLHLILGESAALLGREKSDPQLLAEARDHFAAVLQQRPTSMTAANNLAWLLAHHLGDPEEAIRVAEQARGGASPAELPVNFVDTLASVYRLGGRTADAKALLQEALASKPDVPMLIYQLGLVYVDEKQPEAARGLLEKALKLGLSDEQAAEARRVLSTLAPPAVESP